MKNYWNRAFRKTFCRNQISNEKALKRELLGLTNHKRSIPSRRTDLGAGSQRNQRLDNVGIGNNMKTRKEIFSDIERLMLAIREALENGNLETFLRFKSENGLSCVPRENSWFLEKDNFVFEVSHFESEDFIRILAYLRKRDFIIGYSEVFEWRNQEYLKKLMREFLV